METLVFGKSKNRLQVDLGDLQDETEHLSSFLQSSLKVEPTSFKNRLAIESEELFPKELQRVVNKFIYRQHLNGTHWVSLEGSVVKINKFQNAKKPEKNKKPGTSPTFAHGF